MTRHQHGTDNLVRTIADADVRWSLQEFQIVLRKYGRMIGIFTGATVLLAIIYVAAATRQYTSVSRLLIDTPRSPLAALEGTPSGSATGLAIPEVESSLQVLVSEGLALSVLNQIDTGRLKTESEQLGTFEHAVAVVIGLPRRIFNYLSGASELFDPQRAALEKLMNGLSVRRVGSSYVLEISYTSPDPQRSADIANLFASQYVQQEINTKAEIWRRASVWLQIRVDELRQKSEDAARAAQDFKAANGNNADTWPKARELERTAEAYDALYSAFLRRYTDSIQQQTFPISQARVITEASKPQAPSQPRSLITIALAIVLGSGLGTSIAFIRWSLDRAIRSPAQILRYGFRCLSVLPKLPKVISRDPSQVMRTMTRAPRSQFSENLRLVRAEISLLERQKTLQVVGLTSAFAAEGKSSVAANLAQLYATTSPTLLIDADTRNPQISRTLGASSTELMKGVFNCPPLDFLRAGPALGEVNPTWFEDGGFETLLNLCRSKYEKIIVDLPPASVVAEARYAAPLLDAVIVVAEWEATPAESFIACIDACNSEPGKVIGAILNKAHASVMPMGSGSSATRSYFENEPPQPLPFRRYMRGDG